MAEERDKRMSILIRGMPMPKNCKGCRFKGPKPYWDDDGDRHIGDACMLCGELVDAKIRSSVCPLIEVPKHGDLIDRSMMLNTVSNRMFEFPKGHEEEYDFWARVYDFIVNAPIVIEADDSIKEVEWETHNDGIMYWWECSRCHHEAWYDKDYLPNYCPYCGAKMKNEE